MLDLVALTLMQNSFTAQGWGEVTVHCRGAACVLMMPSSIAHNSNPEYCPVTRQME